MHEEKINSFQEMIRIIIPALVAISLFIFSSFYLFIPSFEKVCLKTKNSCYGNLSSLPGMW